MEGTPGFHCAYVLAWTEVKRKWDLVMDAAEAQATELWFSISPWLCCWRCPWQLFFFDLSSFGIFELPLRVEISRQRGLLSASGVGGRAVETIRNVSLPTVTHRRGSLASTGKDSQQRTFSKS
jgi:hypothetical protein